MRCIYIYMCKNKKIIIKKKKKTFKVVVKWLKSPNSRDVTKRAIIEVNSMVSGSNYDTLTSIIAKLLTSQPFGGLNR